MRVTGSFTPTNDIEAAAILRLEALERGQGDPVETAMQDQHIPREYDVEADEAWDRATVPGASGYDGPRGQLDYGER